MHVSCLQCGRHVAKRKIPGTAGRIPVEVHVLHTRNHVLFSRVNVVRIHRYILDENDGLHCRSPNNRGQRMPTARER